MAKSKEKIEDLATELESAATARDLLQSTLDWLGEVKARVSWYTKRKGDCDRLSLRVNDLIVDVEYADPISGLLEAIEMMRERLARRRINQGVK